MTSGRVPAGQLRTVSWTVTVPPTTPSGADLTATPVVSADVPLAGLPNLYSVPPLTVEVN
ncbi:hypothetical protein MF672_031060 [Actinomadura sp. ATCC 31491]|uniref:Uncharacterized protein n=1 Tax=Actinomadura luzonensis TaxID=2805427 RepID=A0ABT0G0U4_9ACTN|nr:hypothetical protein [Actinomadura luzonensis]MCK2218198.1 hypothetical protein [Actinomadura luzonensis]